MRVYACEFVWVCVREGVRVRVTSMRACVRLCLRVPVCVYVCAWACVKPMCVCACPCVHPRACVRVIVCVFPCYLQYVPRNPTSDTASLPQRRGLLMFVWVWNILVTYHDVPDLHIHEYLHEYMYVRILGCMSTPLYVHVTHTQNTNTHAHTTYTTHNNTFSTRLFFHQISFKVRPKHPNYSDESAHQS